MRFHADLHIHSKYSRATSRDLDLEHLAWWAARKGIGLVGTGDFCHPAWAAELKEKLVPAEPGPVPAARGHRARRCRDVAAGVPRAGALHARGRDLDDLQEGRQDAEDPSPDLRAGFRDRRSHRGSGSARIGNIKSDGRPILGLELARPAGDHAGVRTRRLSRAGAYLDAVVRGARLAVRLRHDRGLLRRSQPTTSSRSRPGSRPIRR